MPTMPSINATNPHTIPSSHTKMRIEGKTLVRTYQLGQCREDLVAGLALRVSRDGGCSDNSGGACDRSVGGKTTPGGGRWRFSDSVCASGMPEKMGMVILGTVITAHGRISTAIRVAAEIPARRDAGAFFTLASTS